MTKAAWFAQEDVGEEMGAFLQASAVLQLADFDGLVRQFLYAIHGISGREGVREALTTLHDQTDGLERSSVENWSVHTSQILKMFFKDKLQTIREGRHMQETSLLWLGWPACAGGAIGAWSMMQVPPTLLGCWPLLGCHAAGLCPPHSPVPVAPMVPALPREDSATSTDTLDGEPEQHSRHDVPNADGCEEAVLLLLHRHPSKDGADFDFVVLPGACSPGRWTEELGFVVVDPSAPSPGQLR